MRNVPHNKVGETLLVNHPASLQTTPPNTPCTATKLTSLEHMRPADVRIRIYRLPFIKVANMFLGRITMTGNTLLGMRIQKTLGLNHQGVMRLLVRSLKPSPLTRRVYPTCPFIKAGNMILITNTSLETTIRVTTNPVHVKNVEILEAIAIALRVIPSFATAVLVNPAKIVVQSSAPVLAPSQEALPL